MPKHLTSAVKPLSFIQEFLKSFEVASPIGLLLFNFKTACYFPC